MPEYILSKLKNRIPLQWKVCFLAAVAVGFLAHFYKITNWLPNWDSLVFRYDGQNMIEIGRWFLPVVTAFSSFYDLPWLAGLIAILFHGVGAVCITKMFAVQKCTTAALIGGLIASFPTVTSVMTYNYVADGYALAFVFSCAAAMLLTAEKPKFIVPVILIALSAGIYQAYITVTVMLLLCRMIVLLVHNRKEIKPLVLSGVRFLLAGALGMAIYYLMLTVILKITGTELLDYQGVNSAASLGGIDLAGSLYVIKHNFTDYFFDFSEGITVFTAVNCVVCLLTAVFYIRNIIRNKLSFPKILVLGVLIVLLPIGASILAFINSHVDYHNLMKMGFAVFYLFFLLEYEKTDFEKVKLNTAKAWAILLTSFVLISNYTVIANVSYHTLGMAYEKSYGTLIRIADRIEQTEGSENCGTILVLGELEDSDAYSAYLSLHMTGITEGHIIRADDEVVGQSVLCSMLNDYCGTDYRFLAGEEKAALLEKINGESMGSWPAKDSVLVYEDVIVIKLGD